MGAIMFYRVMSETREYISEQGEIEFKPIVKWKTFNLMKTAVKHEIVFKYKHKPETDRLGSFYLIIDGNELYEMTKVRFTADHRTGLRSFVYELIVKHALKQAEEIGVRSFVIECDDPLIVDTLLSHSFRIRKLEQLTIPDEPIYRGEKELAQKEIDCLNAFRMGIGCP
jgi:hypothetical protein